MFSETRAGVRTLIPNDLAQEVSPHSKEVPRQEVRIILPLTHGHAPLPLQLALHLFFPHLGVMTILSKFGVFSLGFKSCRLGNIRSPLQTTNRPALSTKQGLAVLAKMPKLG